MEIAVSWVMFGVLVLIVVANRFRKTKGTKKFEDVLRRGLFVIAFILLAGLIGGVYFMGEQLS
ncbi:hypothetical protein [Massilia frigida]|uniref:hypothetical protein n=1 Tax=Massilia frigida TaxID=2609281 RepID=UPI00141EAFC7|nr:hypothetical protein [Massilia frigida]